MVTIPLRASIFSLVVTLTSVVVELACLHGLFTLNALLESRALRQGKLISVRRHRIRSRLLAVFATACFVSVEVFTSANTHTDFVTRNQSQPCVRLIERRRFDSDSAVQRGNADLSVDGGAEAIGLSCVQVRNGTFSFRGGNYSARNGAVQCEEKAVYSYRPNARQLRSPFERGMTSFCKENFCVSVLLADENTLLISEPYDGRSSRNANASFFVTHVHFSLRAARLRWIARNIQQLYSISVLEELELRRQTLLQSQTARCEFEVERREVSMIKGWTFVTALLFWICCVLFFVAMAALKRGVLYDMNNAMHWATRTCHPPGGDSTAAGVVGGRAAAFVRLDSYDSDRPLVSVMATAGTPPPANAQYEEDTTSPQL